MLNQTKPASYMLGKGGSESKYCGEYGDYFSRSYVMREYMKKKNKTFQDRNTKGQGRGVTRCSWHL